MITANDKIGFFQRVIQTMIVKDASRQMDLIQSSTRERLSEIETSLKDELQRKKDRLEMLMETEKEETIGKAETTETMKWLEMKKQYLEDLTDSIKKDLSGWMQSKDFFDYLKEQLPGVQIDRAQGNAALKPFFDEQKIPYEITNVNGVILFNDVEGVRYDYRLERILDARKRDIALRFQKEMEV